MKKSEIVLCDIIMCANDFDEDEFNQKRERLKEFMIENKINSVNASLAFKNFNFEKEDD